MKMKIIPDFNLKMNFKSFSAFIIAFLFLTSLISCGVSYPKETLIQSLEKLVKKETGKDAKALIIGRTLYLDMELKDLTSNDRSAADRVIKDIQAAAFAVTRVVLSSDSDIKYMITNIHDSDKYVNFKIIQCLEDIKSYFYMRISRDDYLSRNLTELETLQRARRAIDDKKDLSDEEFVGRLIVSNINTTGSKANPFLATLLSSLDLRYRGIKNNILIVVTGARFEDSAKPVIEQFMEEKVREFAKKYNQLFYGFALFSTDGSLIFQKIFANTIVQSKLNSQK